MNLHEMRHKPILVPDKLVGEPFSAQELSVGFCYQRPLVTAHEGRREKLTVNQRYLHRAKSPRVRSTVDADILCQQLRRDPYRRFLRGGEAANPMIAADLADRFEHRGIGCQLHVDPDAERLSEGSRIREGHIDSEMAEVLALVAFGHPEGLRMRQSKTVQPSPVVES